MITLYYNCIFALCIFRLQRLGIEAYAYAHYTSLLCFCFGTGFIQVVLQYRPLNKSVCYYYYLFLHPGSARIRDALGDTGPPALPVLRSLFNLVPADVHFPDVLLDDSLPVLSRSTWPPPETLGFPLETL